MLDIFSSHPAFNMTSMTAAINVVPNLFGRINGSNLFRPVPIRVRTAVIERKNGLISLLKSQPVGAPPPVAKSGDRKVYTLPVPHFPYDDVVLAEEVQGVRAFGSETELETVIGKVNEKLENAAWNHQQTWEFLKLGAIKGIVLDGDATTELADLYDIFGITPEIHNFALDVDTTEVLTKCLEVARHIELNLLGEVSSGIQVLCSPTFFDALTTHPIVKEAYKDWRQGEAGRSDMRKGFVFGDLTFSEYNGSVNNAAGGSTPLIAANTAHAFPIGTRNLFLNHMAPANMAGAVNTPGLPMYASRALMDHDMGVKLHTQSNHLPICTRPEVLVKLTVS